MNDMLADKLISIVGKENVLLSEPMSIHTTFHIGGPAQYFVRPTTEEQLINLVRACEETGVRRYVLGLGSDLLVSDAGLSGVVIQIADNFANVKPLENNCVYAEAGASNEQVARVCQSLGLAGYEFASGIPGSIGGAAIMNAGAYDGQFSDVAVSVRCITLAGEVFDIPAEEAAWAYRKSRMNDEDMVVVSAVLKLHPDDPEAIQARMDDLSERRSSKQPLEMPSAGSTFKRPEGYFAGKLIQDSGMQGHSVGGAQVSTKHAGFVVNAGNASAEEVLELIRQVQQKVFEDTNVMLEPEVRMWGFDN